MSPEAEGSSRRRSLVFLAKFAVLLVAFYFLVAWRPVNDAVIVPFTAGVARVSAAMGPSVRSCPGHWSVRPFGSLRSRSPTGIW